MKLWIVALVLMIFYWSENKGKSTRLRGGGGPWSKGDIAGCVVAGCLIAALLTYAWPGGKPSETQNCTNNTIKTTRCTKGTQESCKWGWMEDISNSFKGTCCSTGKWKKKTDGSAGTYEDGCEISVPKALCATLNESSSPTLGAVCEEGDTYTGTFIEGASCAGATCGVADAPVCCTKTTPES